MINSSIYSKTQVIYFPHKHVCSSKKLLGTVANYLNLMGHCYLLCVLLMVAIPGVSIQIILKLSICFGCCIEKGVCLFLVVGIAVSHSQPSCKSQQKSLNEPQEDFSSCTWSGDLISFVSSLNGSICQRISPTVFLVLGPFSPIIVCK